MKLCVFFYPAYVISLLAFPLIHEVDATRIRGGWNHDGNGSGDKIKFLGKFGVERDHEVFTYGNCSRADNSFVAFDDKLALAFIPTSVWDKFYDREKKGGQCETFMSDPFNRSIAPDDRCSVPGDGDYFRVVPCDIRKPCQNQHSVPLVSGSQFTFRTESTSTQYYYLVLVACLQNYSANDPCQWGESGRVAVDYDIHIVNNDPDKTVNPDPFVFEFPYNLIGLMVVYIVFTFIYLTLLVFHVTMHTRLCTPTGYRHHRLTFIFGSSLLLEFLHIALVMTHYSVFSVNGMGVVSLLYIGQAANFMSDWLLILVLILIGKGWQLTTATVRWKKVTAVIWVLYIVISGLFFVWTVIQETVFPFSAERVDVYHTWAGGLYVAYRLLLLIYILYEMRQVYLIENRHLKLILYRCLLVLYLLWFCYLPVGVIVARILDALERQRVIAASVLTFDLLINAVMVLLFCPKWSDQYFQFNSHLNYLTRVSMKRSKMTQYNSVSSFLTSSTSEDT